MIEASQAEAGSNDACSKPHDLSVQLGRLHLKNPVLVASGTFGYAREMAGIISLAELGGILPKTITQSPRPGNAPWRTVETSAGLLNAIGLDNDGIDYFLANHWPYLKNTGSQIIVSQGNPRRNLLSWRLGSTKPMEFTRLSSMCPVLTYPEESISERTPSCVTMSLKVFAKYSTVQLSPS